MKKAIIPILFAIIAIFGSSCKESFPPMNGFWLCTGIGGDIFGNQANLIQSKYLSLFSIGYAGLASTGYFTRVGQKDLAETTSLAAQLASRNWGSLNNWNNYFSYGSFSYNESLNTVTHRLNNSEVETFKYELSSDQKTLKLITSEVNMPTANSVTNIINDLFGTTINTNIGIVYTYKKVKANEILTEIKNLLKTDN